MGGGMGGIDEDDDVPGLLVQLYCVFGVCVL